jgi:hypothetical protein
MRYLFLSCFFLLFIASAKSQMGGKEYDCISKFKLSANQRLNQFPFNHAKKIQIISFSSGHLTVPVNKKSINWSQVKDSVTLNKKQINSLTELLFNLGFKGNRYTKNVSTAIGLDLVIAFFDSANNLFEYIEVCFNCGEIDLVTSKRREYIGMPCNQRLEKIKDFSIKSGLHF